MDILEKILLEKENRIVLIKEFQTLIWDDENADEILGQLAYDLDFYEPNEEYRKQDASYYADDKLEETIMSALQKLKNPPTI